MSVLKGKKGINASPSSSPNFQADYNYTFHRCGAFVYQQFSTIWYNCGDPTMYSGRIMIIKKDKSTINRT